MFCMLVTSRSPERVCSTRLFRFVGVALLLSYRNPEAPNGTCTHVDTLVDHEGVEPSSSGDRVGFTQNRRQNWPVTYTGLMLSRRFASRATAVTAPRTHSRQMIRLIRSTGKTKKGESTEAQQQHRPLSVEPNSVCSSLCPGFTSAPPRCGGCKEDKSGSGELRRREETSRCLGKDAGLLCAVALGRMWRAVRGNRKPYVFGGARRNHGPLTHFA